MPSHFPIPFRTLALCGAGALMLLTGPAWAAPFTFSTGTATDRVGMASRTGPSSGVNQETEAADDFTLSTATRLNSASFTGLLPSGAALSSVSNVTVEIYQVFPKGSDPGRTIRVPTRANSPSDDALTSRSSDSSELSFTLSSLASSFTVLNSVDTGINPSPGERTSGEGAKTGQEVRFDVTFTVPLELPADSYFFVPQVTLADASQHFLWLSATNPIVAPGTPFVPDRQAWIRNASLAPDWLRVETDIIGSTATNAAFSLVGETVPEPGTLGVLGAGLSMLLATAAMRRRPR